MKVLVLVLSVIFLATLANPALAAKPTPTPTPQPGIKSVCIDPGHGGIDIGSSNEDLLEKDVNLQVAQLLKGKLEPNYTVYMTRENDDTLSNAGRYNYCNSQNATILISIHHNGSTNQNTNYSLGLYMKKSDVALAQEVVSSVSSALGLPSNGISRFASGVLLKSNMPSTISEGFFLTNSNEYNLIKTSNRLDQEAQALFSAINTYFDK
ncbi:MAG: N-acetylmuramoyl-L-alanine amidase [bacterium]|nr:N-acetylmuramoyl-L-alanine amidase [bacterium]